MKTKMNNKVKALLMACCAVLLVFASVIGTLAYLTDTKTVTNTFTVGKVDIELKESRTVNNVSEDTASGFEYHLLPGLKYEKKALVTVIGKSESAYVRINMTIHNADKVTALLANNQTVEALFATNDVSGFNSNNWDFTISDVSSDNTILVEFRYKGAVEKSDDNTTLAAPFTHLVIPSSATNEQLAALVPDTANGDPFKIVIEANAIQTAGIEADTTNGLSAVDVAWKAFEAQS